MPHKLVFKAFPGNQQIASNKYYKSVTWLSPAFQNEIIHFLDDEVRTSIKQGLHEVDYFTILANEIEDISNFYRILYVNNYKTVECLTGYMQANELNANTLSAYILSRIFFSILALTNVSVSAMMEHP